MMGEWERGNYSFGEIAHPGLGVPLFVFIGFKGRKDGPDFGEPGLFSELGIGIPRTYWGPRGNLGGPSGAEKEQGPNWLHLDLGRKGQKRFFNPKEG